MCKSVYIRMLAPICNKDMWIGLVILVTLTFSAFLIMLRLFSNSYKSERIRVESRTSKEIVDRIENIRTFGREENGWRNNFPSVLGWERTTLQIAKDFILVTGQSKFPFLFNTELQPFIISLEPERLAREIAYDRIFKPSDIRIANYGSDLELTIKPSGVLGQIKVHLTFENIGKRQIERLLEVTNWR